MTIVSNVFTQLFLFTMAGVFGASSALAQEITIPAYKDDLFNYSAVLETDFNGAFELKDYDEMRDVNGRDEIPVKKALAQYVDQDIIGSETEETLKSNGTKVEYLQAGAAKDASFVVIFAHGANGTKLLGMQDWTFGGNFNRLKHFAIHENGTSISPSFTDFERGGSKTDSDDRESCARSFTQRKNHSGLRIQWWRHLSGRFLSTANSRQHFRFCIDGHRNGAKDVCLQRN